MKVTKGMRVRVYTGEGTGSFVGEVSRVDKHMAFIRPDERAVRQFLGDEDYVLGAAHWDSRLKIVSADAAVTATPRVQIVHSRDPDSECGLTVFVDDVRWSAEIEDIDPGRGWTRADWNVRIEDWEGSETNYGQAVLAELEAASGNQYITD